MLVGAAVGYVSGKIHPPQHGKLGERILALSGASLDDEEDDDRPKTKPTGRDIEILTAFSREMSAPDIEFSEVLWAIPMFAQYTTPEIRGSIHDALKKTFDPEKADLADDFLAACDLSDHAAYERLKARAEQPSPLRYANFSTGQIEMRQKNYQAAFAHFHKEGERLEATESRALAVHALVRGKNFATLTALKADPNYSRYITPYVRLEIAIEQRDWRGILRESPRCQIDSYESGLVIVTAIAGLAWALFLGHLGEIPSVFSKTSAICVVALVAGVLSTVPTVYLVILENDILHLSSGFEPLQIFAYDIGGVALREELSKLLLFLPLLPILIHRKDELEATLAASFVGLGFAIEENCGYFMTSEASSAPARFLTANFFHIALTGMAGLALYRACTRGVAGINHFLMIFPLCVLAHGAYDGLLDLPDSDIGGYAANIILVAFSAFYFSQIHPLCSHVRSTLGLTGAFVASISLLAATVIAYEMINLGPTAGLTAIFPQLLGSAILLFMFFREFNEPLSE